MKTNTVIKYMAAALAVALSPFAQATQTEVPGVAEQPDSYFYTGKPYDADLGGYTFAARTYDPQVNRWTSADPSGFPDGANCFVYVSNQISNHFDGTGLESEDIHADYGYNLPVIGNWVTGTWDGAFVWSFAHGDEEARVETEPGFSGFTGIPLTVEIGGVNIGVGFQVAAHVINKSAFETKTENGYQWKRWVVDLEVKWDSTLTLIVDVDTKDLGSKSKKLYGDWYE